jgi:UDP-glucuronate decarboxylase
MRATWNLRAVGVIVATLGSVGAASASITPIGQFNGQYQESFENFNFSWTSGNVPVFSGLASVHERSQGSLIVTSSWSFNGVANPKDGSRFMGSPSSWVEYNFNSPIASFGGFFTTNSSVADGRVDFFLNGRILVTGGAGFLGSHLCDRLVAQGHDVICLDNLFTSQKINIEHLLGKPTSSSSATTSPPLWLEVDEIYNMACPAAPGHYQYNPIKTMKTSVMGAINVLGMAKRCRAKVLQASTSEVYGDPEVHPQPESYRGNVNPIGPRACYDEGKRAAETLFFDYHRMNNVNIRVIRIFNTYGPRMHPFDGRVVSNFIRQALRGEDITIFGDGKQSRSFCYVDDLIEGIIRMMNGPDDFIGPVNLGNPVEFTMKQLAEQVIELSAARASSCTRPSRRRPDPAPARHLAGQGSPRLGAQDPAARRPVNLLRLDHIHRRRLIRVAASRAAVGRTAARCIGEFGRGRGLRHIRAKSRREQPLGQHRLHRRGERGRWIRALAF